MGKMKLKSSKKKYGRFIRKNILYMIIIYTIFSITFYYSLNNSKKIDNTKFIKFLLGGGNSHMMTDYKMINIVNSSTNFLFNIETLKLGDIMILVIENVDKNLCIAIKNVVKLKDANWK